MTKSGTNNWHGTVAGTETNSVLTSLDNFETAEGLTKPPRFNQEFTSGTIGGPIWKDKVFFFGGFDDEINFLEWPVYVAAILDPHARGSGGIGQLFSGEHERDRTRELWTLCRSGRKPDGRSRDDDNDVL